MTIAYGSTLEVETAAGSGVFFKIAKITSMPKPKPTVAQVDITEMESPGRAEQQEPGLANYGELTYNLLWNPGSASDVFVEAWRASGETRQVRTGYGQTGVKDTYPGFVLEYDAGAGAPGEAFKGSITIKCAGLPLRS